MPDILCEIEDGVATVTLNRPALRNSVTYAMWREVGDIFARLDEDRSVRSVLLTGAGDDFSAGADIAEFGATRDDKAQSAAYEVAVDYGCARIAHIGKPVIAATKGYCLGGAAHLAMSCDFRFTHPKAIFGIPAARLSIVYGVQATRKLAALVGLAEAKRILYSAERFDARKALSIGFVDRVDDDPLEAARTYARSLATSAPLTIAGAKYILNGGALGTFDAEEAARMIGAASDSHDYREGRAAFAEKRPPAFIGA
ncbi:enoyl-CoA hydratase/isomerase family protein [Mesorhizobium australicum]|uniref:Enoyl-CoA hydratase/carnithine racemase n=1 Tax=Mesorhizobium australicum TaxID=536018 RepID=A0A1X7MTF9_9HYPH|nr:enoyl-CoA hydratase-related protein [Mesorhizobium australicum]SMH27621.1 Enoyl-CoA hydratase/carnithine racemase [Mesorhizobium australicum]